MSEMNGSNVSDKITIGTGYRPSEDLAHLPSYTVTFGGERTLTEVLAVDIADAVFPNLNAFDREKRNKLTALLMAFAAEIRRSAIEP